jgi:hypothetical protein
VVVIADSAAPAKAPVEEVFTVKVVDDAAKPAAPAKTPEAWPPTCAAPACGTCCDGPSLWARLDYLHWWAKGARVPPLVTASPEGTSLEDAGVLGRPGTIVLFGGDEVIDDARHGARLAIGAWLDERQGMGVELSAFWLRDEDARFTASSDGQAILARPFFDVLEGLPSSELVAFPEILRGNVRVAIDSQTYGGELLARCCLHEDCAWKLWATGGYRFFHLAEGLHVVEDLEVLEEIVPAGTRILVKDDFGTRNRFHGLDLGLVSEVECGCLTLHLRAKLALGVNRQRVNVGGGTAIFVPGEDTFANAGGLLALNSNIGQFAHDEFAILPEIGLAASYAVTSCLRASVGYSFLYLNEVVRPGNQIDLGINTDRLPPGATVDGVARPARQFQSTDFWLQGFNLGVELRY